MKMIILSSAVALGLAFLAAYVLAREQRPAYEAFVGSGADVRDPGHNLVGPRWNGLYPGDAPAS
jgi:hypothetical protein